MVGNFPHHAEEKKHWVRITRCCNNNCVFCLDRDSLDGTMVPKEEVVRDLEKGIEEGAVRAVISGGDPTVHRDFIEIVGIASNMRDAVNQRLAGTREL